MVPSILWMFLCITAVWLAIIVWGGKPILIGMAPNYYANYYYIEAFFRSLTISLSEFLFLLNKEEKPKTRLDLIKRHISRDPRLTIILFLHRSITDVAQCISYRPAVDVWRMFDLHRSCSFWMYL
jgi:hypothetical protein